MRGEVNDEIDKGNDPQGQKDNAQRDKGMFIYG